MMMMMNDDDEDDLSHSSSPLLSTFVFNPPSPGGSNIKEDWRRQIKVNWLPLSLKHVLFFLPPSPCSQNRWNTWFPNPAISIHHGFRPLWATEEEEGALLEIFLIQSSLVFKCFCDVFLFLSELLNTLSKLCLGTVWGACLGCAWMLFGGSKCCSQLWALFFSH